MRLWPRSLAGQLIAVLLPALALSQVLGFVISADERVRSLRTEAREEFLVRTASVAKVIESTPVGYHDAILSAMATINSRFWLTQADPENVAEWRAVAWLHLQQPLPAKGDSVAVLGTFEPNIEASATLSSGWQAPPAGVWPHSLPARFVELDTRFGSGLVITLPNGRWLNAAFAKPYYGQIWQSQSLVAITLTALVLSVLAVLIARHIARPMHRLAEAADALGRGEDAALLAEEGPDDIRRMASAFNRMQDRLKRFISDRTAMLAAIGHDLRTPITSLRLRAEFVRDPDEREKFLATLDDMQAMTEATLTFAREQAVGEPTRLVDVAALTESICSDLADLGRDVSFAESERIAYRCRPTALGRAIRNLVENAARYGDRARVSLSRSSNWLEIVVDDDGEGVPEAEFERVFAPFVRLESSRSRETGGTGLGLSIARTIARSHGGDVVLENRETGLRAIIRLPETRAAGAAQRVDYAAAAE